MANLSKLSLLLASVLSVAHAVSLDNYEGLGCTGHSLTCTDLWPSECCGILGLSGNTGSTRARGLPPTGIVTIHDAPGNPANGHCGLVWNSGIGGGCIDGDVETEGSMWHSINCSNVCKRGEEEDLMSTFLALDKNKRHEQLNQNKCKRTVTPDKLTLADGEIFEIGEGTGAEDVAALLGVARNNKRAGLSDVPMHLHKHRVRQAAWKA